MTESMLRAALAHAAQSLARQGLSPGRSGNLSARFGEGILITPTGIAFEALAPSDIAAIRLDGTPLAKGRVASSEWPMHAAIYAGRPEAMAIVHLHSRFATALSCLRRDIPGFHYMVATLGGSSIVCADYATFGSETIARNALAAMAGGQQGCLLANHGQVVHGRDVEQAMELAAGLETLAMQYLTALTVGEPTLLDAEEMAVNVDKFRTYGQPQG